MLFFVYILYSKELHRYYIAFTENVSERLKKHLANHSGFTGKAKDWEIKLIEEFPTKVEAIARESQLKRWKNRARLEVLITKWLIRAS